MKKEKIKIVHIVEGFIGGLAVYMFHVLPALCQQGFDVTLICSLNRKERGMAEKLKVLQAAGVKVRYLPMRRGITPLTDLYCLLALWRLFRTTRYNIIHTHCSKAGALGRIAALLANISPRLHSSHCFAYLRCNNIISKRLFYWIEKILSKITSRYIAVSSSEIDNALSDRLYPKTKCQLIENGIPLPKLLICNRQTNIVKNDLKIPNNKHIITTGCRFINYKGLELLLNAARYVQSDCHFIIAGQGQLTNRLKKIIVHNNLQDKVTLLTPTVTMEHLLRISDIAILCSTIEAQPYFLLEAMAARCPIIATDVPGNHELLGSNRGILTKSLPLPITNAIDVLLADESLRKNLADSAYTYVLNQHSLEKQVNRLAHLYRMENNQNNNDRITINVRENLKNKAV